MLIKYTTGDMFQSGAECLVNTVNCEGYMGQGIAYQFKLKFPENNKAYIKACKDKTLHVGTIHTFVENGITIVNFPTKDKWRENSKISYIETALDVLVERLPKLNVKSVAIPPLGCGNGGLDWQTVKELIQKKLKPIADDFTVLIYEPQRNYVQKAATAPKLTAASLVLMKLKMGLKRCTKLRLQKAAYFMNLYLEEPYFSFQKYKYGPYAHSIDIVGRNIGEYQSFYGLNDTESTYQLAYQVICSEKTTKLLNRLSPAIEKAVAYVNGIESDHELEGLATVTYLVQTFSRIDASQIVSEFKQWSDDKATRFTEDEIKKYIDCLEQMGVIERDIMGNYCISEYLSYR